MNVNHSIISKLLSAFMVVMVLLLGCDKDDSTKPEEATAPQIPPPSTFVIDFSDFDTTGQSLSKAGPYGAYLTNQNWGWAALNVAVWNTIITFNLAIPVAAFGRAMEETPQQQNDGTWVWEYTFYVLGIPHSAELHGTVTADGVDWEMYISRNGGYSDFLWYTGHNNLLLTEGTWELNRDPNNATPYIGILWHRDIVNETADIKYTNIIPDDPGNGGYIFYGITTDTTYDAFYDIYHVQQQNHINIEWDRTIHEGRVMDAVHFGDSEWRCWDSNLDDVDCP